MELEEKINLSNESLDKLLNSKIQIKLILEYQNYIVVNNELEFKTNIKIDSKYEFYDDIVDSQFSYINKNTICKYSSY